MIKEHILQHTISKIHYFLNLASPYFVYSRLHLQAFEFGTHHIDNRYIK